MRRRLSLLSALLFACLFALPAHAAPEAGKVVSLTPGVFVERGGKRLPLEIKSPVEAGDTLTTDATGRARILFTDDSSMSVGPNTTLALQEFTPGGSKPAVKAHLAKGLLRSITGRIVEQNPEGFALTSPEATVGIRGTIITMRAVKGFTTVFVENTTRKVLVNGVNVPSGKKVTVPGASIRPEDIRPEDRREIGRDLAFRGGIGVAAAAPEPSSASERKSADYLLADYALPTPDTALGGLPLLDVVGPGSLSGGGLTATYSTTMASSGINMFNVNVGFNINLSSGAISGAYMDGNTSNPYIIGFVLTGGSGLASAGGFSVTGFTGAVGSDLTSMGMASGSMSNAAPFTPGDPTAATSITLTNSMATESGSFTLNKQ